MRPLRRIGAAIALGTVTVIGPCLPALEASATPPTPPTTATPNAAQLTRQAYVLDEIGAFDGNLVEDTNRLSNGASFEVAYVATSSLKVAGTGEALRQSLKSYLVDKEVAFTRDGDISPNVVVVAVPKARHGRHSR